MSDSGSIWQGKNNSTNGATAMQWFANSAYYWLNEVMSSTYNTTTTQVLDEDDNVTGTTTSLSDNPQMDAYNTFTALMINHLYKKNNPFSSLSTGYSAYFPTEDYGDFTKYPGYIWNLITYNLSYLVGLQLYKGSISDLYPCLLYTSPSPRDRG